MKHFSAEFKTSVINDYNAGALSTSEIAIKYGISRRRIYDWVKPNRNSSIKSHYQTIKRLGIRLTREEVEFLLLMLLETEKIHGEKHRGVRKTLEERLLNMADEMESVSRLKTEK